jgi:bacteriocin-like protein
MKLTTNRFQIGDQRNQPGHFPSGFSELSASELQTVEGGLIGLIFGITAQIGAGIAWVMENGLPKLPEKNPSGWIPVTPGNKL